MHRHANRTGNDELIIAPLESEDFPATFALLHATFAGGFQDPARLEAMARHDDPRRSLLAAWCRESLAGMVSTAPMGDADVRVFLQAATASAAYDWSRPGLLERMAVAPEARRQGVGAALVAAALEHLTAGGVSVVATRSWVSGSPDTSIGVFKRAGFLELARISEYWRANSEWDGWACTCGWPCTCGAILMVHDPDARVSQ